MKVLLMITFLAFSASAQTSSKDLSELRKKLGLARDAPILIDRKVRPNGDTLKTFVLIEEQGNKQGKFEKWVLKKNQKNDPTLNLTDEFSDAQFAVIQLVRRRIKLQRERVLRVGNVDEHGRPDGIGVSRSTETRLVRLPVYSYVLVKKNGFWTIVFSDVETSINGQERVNPGRTDPGSGEPYFEKTKKKGVRHMANPNSRPRRGYRGIL